MVDTSVTIYGNLTRNPDLNITGDTYRCNFRLASTERRYHRDTNTYSDGPTVFISVTCWRMLAQHVAASVVKGEPVVVVGRLRQREATRPDGSIVTLTEIDADVVGIDLRRGPAKRLGKISRNAMADPAFEVFGSATPEMGAGGLPDVYGSEPGAGDADLAGAGADLVGADIESGMADADREGELVGAAAEAPF